MTVTPAYLRAMMKTLLQDPSGWGVTGVAYSKLETLARRLSKGLQDPFQVSELWDHLEFEQTRALAEAQVVARYGPHLGISAAVQRGFDDRIYRDEWVEYETTYGGLRSAPEDIIFMFSPFCGKLIASGDAIVAARTTVALHDAHAQAWLAQPSKTIGGLTNEQVREIASIFEGVEGVKGVAAFGSRTTGHFSRISDLDIAVFTDLPKEALLPAHARAIGVMRRASIGGKTVKGVPHWVDTSIWTSVDEFNANFLRLFGDVPVLVPLR